jgi:hypothetical protein
MKFKTDTCPLCGKACQLNKVAGITFFSCPTKSFIDKQKSHYEVNIEGEIEFQRIVVFPYAIDSSSKNYKSRVYHLKHKSENDLYSWQLIMEVSLIRAEPESKLLERLTTLVTFL